MSHATSSTRRRLSFLHSRKLLAPSLSGELHCPCLQRIIGVGGGDVDQSISSTRNCTFRTLSDARFIDQPNEVPRKSTFNAGINSDIYSISCSISRCRGVGANHTDAAGNISVSPRWERATITSTSVQKLYARHSIP